jgi:hypothetical protein
MATTLPRKRFGHALVLMTGLFLLFASAARSQPLHPVPDAPARFSPAPLPADVLTPNTRQNTPYLKIAARGGFNLTAYSNDRYLDNTLLDVGQNSGEIGVYSSASGFGFGGGAEIEYPISTGMSVVGSVEYQRATFGREGAVRHECFRGDTAGLVDATHEWSARLDYLKFGATFRLGFPTFYLLGGVTGSHLLSSEVERRRVLDDPGCSLAGHPGESSIVEIAPLPDPSAIHLALRLGFGLIYPIAEGLQFSPELTLDFGTSSLNKSPESDLDIYSVSAVLRYELR